MTRKTPLTIAVLILAVAASQVTAAEHILCGEWKTDSLSHKKIGSIYSQEEASVREESPLKMTEREITWPDCPTASYTITPRPDDDGYWLNVPHLECDRLVKDSGQGYLVGLRDRHHYSWGQENTTMLDGNVYDRADSGKEGWKMRGLAQGSFSRNFQEGEKNFFGQISEIPVGMRLVFAQDGTAEGFYFYEKYRSKIPVRAKVEGESISLTVQDNKGNITEKFTGTYKDDELDGTWQSGGKSLTFHFARAILEDHTISCKEMKKFPDKVFAKLDIDLGSGHGSPTEVDYACDGGLASLPFMKTISTMTETIRGMATLPARGPLSMLIGADSTSPCLEPGLCQKQFGRGMNRLKRGFLPGRHQQSRP